MGIITVRRHLRPVTEPVMSEQDKKRRTVRMAVGLGVVALLLYVMYIVFFFMNAAN